MHFRKIEFFFTFVIVPGWIVPLTGLRFPFWYSERKCPDMAGIDKEAAPIMRIRILWSDPKRDWSRPFFYIDNEELRGCGSDYFGQIQKETGADIFFSYCEVKSRHIRRKSFGTSNCEKPFFRPRRRLQPFLNFCTFGFSMNRNISWSGSRVKMLVTHL